MKLQNILKSISLIGCLALFMGASVAKAQMTTDDRELFVSFTLPGESKSSFSYSITKVPVADDTQTDYTIQNPNGDILAGHSPVPAVIVWSPSLEMSYLRTMRVTITNKNSKDEIYSAEVFYYPIKNWVKIQVEKLDPAYSVAQSSETAIVGNEIVPSLKFDVTPNYKVN